MTGSLGEQQLEASKSSTKSGPGPLDWTHRPFGGLILDIKRRYPYYVSDWVDAFRFQNVGKVIATVFFLFFAAVVPAITFGNLYLKDTKATFGVVETILATAISGVLYSMFAGQPITVLGATGPIFAYTVVCYDLAVQFEVEFFPFYFWTLMWCSVITTLIVMFDLCALMRHVTRFSEDLFSGLISLIFIVQAIRPVVENFTDGKKTLPVAFLELILFAFTYQCATVTTALRRTPWMTGQLRAALANFGVFVSICVASAAAQIWYDVEIDMLEIADTFRPTFEKNGVVRSWVVAPMGENGDFPVWAIFFAIVPAIGFAVLSYLDQNLTTVLVNRPSRMLKKPGGYHLDLLIRALVCTPVCAILGLPCAVASTVPSLTHLMALTTYTIEQLPDGGDRKVPVEVVEQRASNLLIHVLIGASLGLSSVLGYVPRSVLLGVFLYMGVASLNGNSLIERLLLWLIWDTKNYPAFEYVQNVPFKRMHFYTFLQAVCLGILYGLNAIKATAFLFPFFMASLMILRKFFGYLFSEEELRWLDGEQMDEPEEEEVELDRQISPWQQNVEPDLEVPFGRGVTPLGKPMQRATSPFGRGLSAGSSGTPRLPPVAEPAQEG